MNLKWTWDVHLWWVISEILISFPLAIYSRNKIVQSYDRSILNFLRDLHAVFHKDYINWHSHQKCSWVPFSPHPHQHLLSFIFWIVAILISMRWYFIVLVTCISLMTSEVERFYLLSIWMSSLEKCLFKSLASLKTGLFGGSSTRFYEFLIFFGY